MNTGKETRLHIIILAGIELGVTACLAAYAWNSVIAEMFSIAKISIWHVWALYFAKICFFGMSRAVEEIEEPEVRIISGIFYKVLAAIAIFIFVSIGLI